MFKKEKQNINFAWSPHFARVPDDF